MRRLAVPPAAPRPVHRTAAVAAFLALLCASGTARAIERPEIMLSWNVPAGTPGAKSNLDRACADTAHADTLYLTYRLKEDHPAFTGTTGLVMFHTAFGDTLTPYWRTAEYPDKPTHLRVEFPSDTGDAGFRAATASTGLSEYAYYTEEQRAIVRLLFAVPPFAATPVAGGRDYCMGRIILRHSADRPGCDRPMCVEFFDSEFKFSLNQPTIKGEQVHSSFVSIHSSTGISCAQHRLNAKQREVVALPLPRRRLPPDSVRVPQR